MTSIQVIAPAPMANTIANTKKGLASIRTIFTPPFSNYTSWLEKQFLRIKSYCPWDTDLYHPNFVFEY
ncbi:hypothetical protein BGZ76_006963 [Entomortierella beljakovae]|nr:hypothetical protein BGZ76_006963 [Entomortierella beljakovae]